MILILTGPTRNRKTTTLMKWSERHHDCGGVLSPDVNGLRVLYNVKTRQSITWQKAVPTTNADLIVGRCFRARYFFKSFKIRGAKNKNHINSNDTARNKAINPFCQSAFCGCILYADTIMITNSPNKINRFHPFFLFLST